jgi:hypothetical protein
VKRYRDSYIRNRYSDSYLANASRRYANGTRYVDGYMAKSAQDGAADGNGKANGSAQSSGSGRDSGRQQGEGKAGLRGLLKQPGGWIAGLGKGLANRRGRAGKGDPAGAYGSYNTGSNDDGSNGRSNGRSSGRSKNDDSPPG